MSKHYLTRGLKTRQEVKHTSCSNALNYAGNQRECVHVFEVDEVVATCRFLCLITPAWMDEELPVSRR